MEIIKYGVWEILSHEKKQIDGRVYFECKCACGTIKDVIVKNLKSGASKSCGCVGKRKLISRSVRHNRRHTRVWRIWQAMKNRCGNKNIKQYRNYGGRGIKVCERWRNSFVAFYEDMGDPPEGMSIDRIDNNGDYEPHNVKWSTSQEQMRNKSSNRKINGICITDISRKLGGGPSLVAKRLARGWAVDKAIKLKSNASL